MNWYLFRLSILDAGFSRPCCKARVCDACAKEVVAIVTCPFCGGDPSPPPEEDCSNDAAIALALSERW